MPNQLATQTEARTKEEKSQHAIQEQIKGEAEGEKWPNELSFPVHILFCIIFCFTIYSGIFLNTSLKQAVGVCEVL